VVFGEQYINSGHAATVIALEPLMFLLIDKKSWKKNLSGKWIIPGLVTGFAGVYLFSQFSAQHAAQSSPGDIMKGTILILLSCVCWVAGTLYAKDRVPDNTSHISAAAIRHIPAAVVCLLIACFSGEWRGFSPARVLEAAWGGLAYLVIMGSLVAFMVFTWLVTVKPPTVVSTHTYVNPLVAVILGWIIAGERIGMGQVAALVMVLLGVVLVNIKEKAARKPSSIPTERSLSHIVDHCSN